MEIRSIYFPFLVILSALNSCSASAINQNAVADVQAVRRQAPLSTTVEKGMNTECKTCPFSVCTNKIGYDAGQNLTLSCYAIGTPIQNDTRWFRTQDDCYVADWDLTEFASDSLPRCQGPSTVRRITEYDTETRYHAECNIMPTISSDNVKYIKAGTSITLTCWKDDDATTTVYNDTMWYKTTDNCYIWRQSLEDAPENRELDNCGPVPFIEHRTPTKRSNSAVFAPELVEKRAELNPAASNYLINMTVGEDFAVCRHEPNENSRTDRRYTFGRGVGIQCYQPGTYRGNSTNWLLTTDFCYVNEVDMWECVCDHYRFPNCEKFS